MTEVKTKLSVRDHNKFVAFIEAIGLKTVQVSYYGQADETICFSVNNLITYFYDPANIADNELMLYLSLKYGGLESAFCDYQQKLLNLYRYI